MKTELKQLDNNFLATFLVTTGLVGRKRGDEEIKLLKAPEKRRSVLLFDPELEVGYLRELSTFMPRERVLNQLMEEISTPIFEKRLSKYTGNYIEKGGDIIEEKSGLGWERLNRECVFEEAEANREIKNILENEEALVVHISPENKDLGYGDNMIVIWLKDRSGTIRRLGFKVKGNVEIFRGIYKRCGGDKKIETNYDLLRNPVEVKNLRLGDLLNMMVLEEEMGKINSEQIRNTVSRAVENLYRSFGPELLHDPDLIFRVYAAAKNEVERVDKEILRTAVTDKQMVERVLNQMPIDLYINGRLTKTKESGGTCALEDRGGQFSKEGWILEVKNGELTSRWGSTENLYYCERCKCWHEGIKCPYCDKN